MELIAHYINTDAQPEGLFKTVRGNCEQIIAETANGYVHSGAFRKSKEKIEAMLESLQAKDKFRIVLQETVSGISLTVNYVFNKNGDQILEPGIHYSWI